MVELLALGTLFLFGLMMIGIVGGLLKLAFWLIFLPFRLALTLLKLVVGVLLLPLFLVLGVIALVGFALVALLGVLVPLLPLIVAVAVVWGLAKAFSRPATVTRA